MFRWWLSGQRLLDCSSKPAARTLPILSSGRPATTFVCVQHPHPAPAAAAVAAPGLSSAQAGTPPSSSPSSSAISKPCNRRREAQRCPFSNLLIGSPFVIFGIGTPGSRAGGGLAHTCPLRQGRGLSLRTHSRLQEGLSGRALGAPKGCCLSTRSQDPDGWGQTGEECLPTHFTSTCLWG